MNKTKIFREIMTQLRSTIVAQRADKTGKLELSADEYRLLHVKNDMGISIHDWLSNNFPNMTIEERKACAA